jgi:phosphopantetheine adenylyltransferase
MKSARKDERETGIGGKSMAKENLFEDLTAEEMRERLQEVSEYMDELICRRRAVCKLHKDDITEDEMWDIAHDVLEIIHFP